MVRGADGLVLKDAVMCDPTPVSDERGYFQWKRAAAFAPVNPWMVEWGGGKVSLFGDIWRRPGKGHRRRRLGVARPSNKALPNVSV